MIASLRVSVWSACDLSCRYCHREGNRRPGRHLSDAELTTLVRAALPAGLRKVKITGGEPLLRPGFPAVLRALCGWGLELSLTTNGTQLKTLATSIKEAGVAKVSVSLDTLWPQRFRQLTGQDALPHVLSGIFAARDAGLPLEINSLLLAHINDDEVTQLTAFAAAAGARLQFIELSPEGNSAEFYQRHHMSLDGLENWLSTNGETLEPALSPADRPRYRCNGVEVSLCRWVQETPAGGRRRQGLRLAADGKVYGFAYGDPPRADLAVAVRAGVRDEALTRLWLAASGPSINRR
ncbi:MAG: radical SAM protein [Thermaerobacter sp.]|nr:radical SAM protein [Thermaerobacter sp.]